MDQYNDDRRNRPITWEQSLTAKSEVTVSGSLRLVDLTDGLVLWEAPFTATDTADTPQTAKSVTTIGEDSRPAPTNVPDSTTDIPDTLLDKVADSALQDGLQTLQGTALLPSGTIPSLPDTNKPAALSGRLLDIDGDSALIGLGAGDGIQKGDVLIIAVSDTVRVKITVTRVRPRTCDATIDAMTPATARAKLSAGQIVSR
jgi:hypothetical protein